MFIEKSLRQECLAQKYQVLLSQALISNKICNTATFNDRTNEYNVHMAALPYSTVNDVDIKVDDSELKAKYEEMKERFKQTVESRDIKYITVQVKASAADKAALDKDMNETAQALAAGGDIAKIVRESGSVIAYSELPVSKNIFPHDIASQLDSMTAGQMKAPYYYAADNTMNIIKLLLVMYDVVIGRKCSCIDEIEYGIHTKALDFLLKMYLTIADNCQFVVTTHDLSLLKSKNLRRDAVRMFEKDEYGVTQIKRKYVHNTMNFVNAYEKILDEQLGFMAESLDSLSKYRGLIQTFYDEFESDKRE